MPLVLVAEKAWNFLQALADSGIEFGPSDIDRVKTEFNKHYKKLGSKKSPSAPVAKVS